MSHTDLPLFAWQPPVQFLAFPLDRQIGKVRDVAGKMVTKTTDRHVEHYQAQVTEALVNRLQRACIPDSVIDEQIGRFWVCVHQEMVRLSYKGHGTGGTAA
jgi:hypothetical protein